MLALLIFTNFDSCCFGSIVAFWFFLSDLKFFSKFLVPILSYISEFFSWFDHNLRGLFVFPDCRHCCRSGNVSFFSFEMRSQFYEKYFPKYFWKLTWIFKFNIRCSLPMLTMFRTWKFLVHFSYFSKCIKSYCVLHDLALTIFTYMGTVLKWLFMIFTLFSEEKLTFASPCSLILTLSSFCMHSTPYSSPTLCWKFPHNNFEVKLSTFPVLILI